MVSQATDMAVTIASGDALDVREITVHEAMSSLFTVTVTATSEDADIDFEAAVGKPASLTLHSTARERTWTGLCNELHQIRVEESGRSTYRLRIVPPLWLTTQRRNHRMFQGMSEIDIVCQVLGAFGIEPVKKLTAEYEKRDCRVQYAETDYAFLSRLLEDVGVCFYFEEQKGQTQLVLADAPQANDPRLPPIPFRHEPSVADEEHVTAVSVGRKHRTDEGATLARKRLDATRADAQMASFASNVVDLWPGQVMSMLDHPHRTLGPGERQLVVESHLDATRGHAVHHQVEVHRASVPYRPAVSTPKPRTHGVESATVVGPAGEEIHTDDLGRVRVHFHWDRESEMNEESSCWIHVNQPWGDTGFGGTSLPRIGQEVIVDFLGGDPDRPVITGRVHTNLQGAARSELFRLQAEKDMHKLVENDETSIVGNDRSRRVKRNEDIVIGKNRTKQVVANEREVTGQNRSVAVGVNRTTQIGNIDSTMVGQTHSVMVMPPGEGHAENATATVMSPNLITLSTPGGASIVLEGSTITLRADDIVLEDKKGGVRTADAGDFVIKGAPKIRQSP